MRSGIRIRLFALSAVTVSSLVAIDATLEPLLGVRLVLGVVAAAFIAAMGAGRAAHTAELLAAAARRMAKGDFEPRTRTLGDVEFHGLGHSLDELAQSLSTTLGELRIERDLLGGILTGMQEGVLLVDPSGRVALLNPALRDMLMIRADSVGTSYLAAIRNPELVALLERARSVSGPTTGEVEVSGIKPRRLLVRASAPADDAPMPRGLLAVFVDVTDIRRLEGIRRDFVANVSHELRTPVTAIRSAAETIRGAASRDPVAAVRFIEIIERNAERLQRLVEDLLDLSRIESREFKLEIESIDLATYVPYILSLFRERAEKKRIRLHARIPPNGPPVFADKRAVEQVISNLVDNAIKYCAPGAEVVVRVAPDPKRETFVRMSVDDTGPGISEHHFPRLFERFYRVDAGRSRDVGGTGLGLSIVKHLVDALGSQISVESTLGRGSSFSFSLPTTPPRSELARPLSAP